MTRRFDYITAEKMSRALLARDVCGRDAAFLGAMAEGVMAPLVATIFTRAVVRIEFIAVGEHSDRRGGHRSLL